MLRREFSPEMQIPEATKVDVAVPGWHINGHGESCRTIFNLSYMEGAVRMVGKDVETIWAGTNLLGQHYQILTRPLENNQRRERELSWGPMNLVGILRD